MGYTWYKISFFYKDKLKHNLKFLFILLSVIIFFTFLISGIYLINLSKLDRYIIYEYVLEKVDISFITFDIGAHLIAISFGHFLVFGLFYYFASNLKENISLNKRKTNKSGLNRFIHNILWKQFLLNLIWWTLLLLLFPLSLVLVLAEMVISLIIIFIIIMSSIPKKEN